MSAEDVAWLEARERGEPVAASPRAAQYESLERAIRSLPVLSSPAAWQREVLAKVDAEVPVRRRRRAALAVAIPVLAAAAGIVLWLALRRPDEPPASVAALQLEVRRGARIMRTTTASRGDTLVVRGSAEGDAELWIYRDQELVTRCPGDAACRGSSAAELVLEVAGRYRAILVLDRPSGPPGRLNEDLAALQRAGARAVTAHPIAVK